MHQSLFFKLFPPPKFLLMPHAGIDISDDAITFIEYSRPVGDRQIIKYGRGPLEIGTIDGGDIKDEVKFVKALTDLMDKYGLLYAKISIPEEKAYLFETEIPYGDLKATSQSIEFKLEENIPLAAADTVFSFDLLPSDRTRPWRASVSAVPRTYIEHMLGLFSKVGIIPMAFETIPRAIARIVAYNGSEDTIVLHSMNRKTGVYVVSGNAVGFTSTVSSGSQESDISVYTDTLAAEVRRVYSFWNSKSQDDTLEIKRIIILGHDAEVVATSIRPKISDLVSVETIDVWKSVLDTTKYVPPILRENSFDYGPSAGLAL